MSLTLDTKNFSAIIDGKTVHLTRMEWNLLSFLAENDDRVCTKDELHEHMWPAVDYAEHPSLRPLMNTLEVYVKYLRNKIGNDYIQTRRGFGYKINYNGIKSE